MYLKAHEQVGTKLGAHVRAEIDVYTRAVETELRLYEFGARVTLTAEVQYAAPTLPEYPKLFIHLRWSAPVQGDKELHVMHGVPVREVTAMIRKDIPSMNMALVDHVYRFAEKLLIELVLIRRPREVTATGPPLQNIPAPRRGPSW